MVQNKFSDDDPYVLPALILTARNNAFDLNVSIQDANYLHSTAVTYQQQGLTSNPVNPVPTVTLVATQTIGAAVGGVDQPPLDPQRNQFDPNPER